jgi:hypothetical protein
MENNRLKPLLPSIVAILLMGALYYSYFNSSIFPYVHQWKNAASNYQQLRTKLGEMTDYIAKNPTKNITVNPEGLWILPDGKDIGVYSQNLIIPRKSPIRFPDIRLSDSPSLTILERQYYSNSKFKKVSMQFQAIGSFKDIGDYLLDLESRKMLYTIDELTLKPLNKSGGRIDLHAKLAIYFVN